jgi:DNA-binding GntR family transcriptional regulator
MQGDEGRAEEWEKYDWEFHRALISACGSNALMGTYASIYDR